VPRIRPADLAGRFWYTSMLISNQVEQTCQVMLGSLAFYPDHPPDFRELAAAAISEHTSRTRAHASGRHPPWLALPLLTCEAIVGEGANSGGPMLAAAHVAAAWELGNVAAGALDAWQDGDTDGALWRRVGAQKTVNLAVGLIGLSFRTLSNLAERQLLPGTAVADVKREFEDTLLQMVTGQHADLGDDLSLDAYRAVATAKTGSLFRLAAWSGARVAGADDPTVGRYAAFGEALGLLIQVWNDLYGLEGVLGKQDATHQRTLPILAALAMAGGGERAQGELEERLRLQEGGRLYAFTEAALLHQEATEALARCPAPGRLALFLDAYSLERLAAGQSE
jgi:hypothetical protein